MKRSSTRLLAATAAAGLLGPILTWTASADTTAIPVPAAAAICADPATGLPEFAPPTDEPLAACQWNMAMIGADSETFESATGEGVQVGIIDSGVDYTHPDLAANVNVELSCSFITESAPPETRAPGEIPDTADPCDDKDAVLDRGGHGTHVASTVASPVNGIGVAGVAPDAEIVALKACVAGGYCMADSVSAALRYAGDQGLDVVNLSLFADPYHFYCKSTAEERAILQQLQSATRYAQQQGVLVVVSAGNDAWDLQHPPELDAGSPNPGEPVERDIENNCVVAPGELPGVLTVSAVGPFGLADYSTTGMGEVEVTAPGGDYFQGPTAHDGSIQSAILAAAPTTAHPDFSIFAGYDPLTQFYPGITVDGDQGPYMYLNGTSMASPHATGVAALLKSANPSLSGQSLKAAVQRTATEMACPEEGAVDDFWSDPTANGFRACQGDTGRNSYFGYGLVNAAAAR